jgi:hypothetical protein
VSRRWLVPSTEKKKQVCAHTPRISWSAAAKDVWLYGVSCEQKESFELSAVATTVPMGLGT